MDYWLKQTKDTPLYPELEWDKPERKDLAGKLLILGGNLHGFAAPAKAFEYADHSGIGHSRILLPDALRSTLHAFWTDAVFCPSSPSGSFSGKSRDLVLNNALWADGILLPGDLGRNSETAILLDEMLRSMQSPLAITKDALDYYIERPGTLINRDNTLIVGSFAQIQKILKHSGFGEALTYTMPLASLVGTLSRFTSEHACTILTRSDNQFVLTQAGKVLTTKREDIGDVWRLRFASSAIVGWLHHPGKPFEAIGNSIVTN